MTDKLTSRAQANPRQLLARILEEPMLVSAVQALAPRALFGLIEHVGLEDAGEIVALATVEQLERVFDEDVWRSDRPGEDEHFDAARFGLWLEIMLEAGAAFAADKVAELPEDLVTLALHRHLIVINLDELALEMSGRSDEDDDALLEKALEGGLYHEFGEYRVIARRHDGWDALVSLLAALDERHPDALQRILERTCHASSEQIADNGGLYDVLTSDEMLESDVAAAREDRRARAGFVAPSAARSFLALARSGSVEAVLGETARDPVTRAYFREYQAVDAALERQAAEASARSAQLLGLVADARADGDGDADADGRAVGRAGRDGDGDGGADAPRRRAAPLLEGPGSADQTLLTRALHELAERDPDRHDERTRELGYLANVLVAGSSRQGRSFRPIESVEAALATCNLGLQRALEGSGDAAVERLARSGCDKLFRVGWRLIDDQVARPAAAAVERLAIRLAHDSDDDAARARLVRLGEAARALLAGGAPGSLWPRLRLLEGLVEPARLAWLRALADHLPWLPRPGDARPELIATAAQLQRARSFLQDV